VNAPVPWRLGTWLRWLGAVSFAGAGACFLVEGWTDPNVFQRQLLWAAGTLAMTVCGIVSIRRLRDATGARVFLGLASATIPAHFAQVGAAVWALREEGVGTAPQVLGACGLLLALSVPLALGISALVRRRARLLTGLMFATGLPLLLPTREPSQIALIAILELGACLVAEAALFRQDPLFKTVEGLAARVLLFIPCAILLVRNAFYPTNALWLAALIGCPACALLLLPRIWELRSKLAALLQTAGALGACAAALVALPTTPWAGLVLSCVALAASEMVAECPKAFAWTSVLLFVAAAIASLFDANAWSALMVVPAGTLHALAGYRRRSVPLLGAAAVSTLAALAGHLILLVHLPKHGAWIPAVIVSVGFLGLASLVESRRSQIERGLGRLHSHFGAKGSEP
jgi:hypothetical protein